MENNTANRKIKEKIYNFYNQYPILQTEEAVKFAKEILADIEKQNKKKTS